MISGILPCHNWAKMGYPWRHAVSCWVRVCDEIILIVSGREQAQQYVHHAIGINEANTRLGITCPLHVRSIHFPPYIDYGSLGSYLLYGSALASNPDWVLALEADYFISPKAGARLRELLINAPAENEVVTARAVTMNYTGTRKLHMTDYRSWFPPYDGFSWERPIGSRPSLGVFPAPFQGVDRFNQQITCEGYIRLRSGKGYGATYHSKMRSLYGDNGFSVLKADVNFEHLLFTKNPEFVAERLKYSYFADQGLKIAQVCGGSGLHDVEYAELSSVYPEYAIREAQLKAMA